MECGINDFILSCYLQDISICDKIIDYHKNSKFKNPGLIMNEKGPIIDHSWKKSIDVVLKNTENLYASYVNALQKICNIYISEYKYCNEFSPWSIIEPITIQYYEPGGGFFKWHTERGSSTYPNCSRHLVFMTYLNDVYDDGETEFLYQKIKFKPKKGLTLIWPADWTHTHRGIMSPTNEKYIVTGWYNFS